MDERVVRQQEHFDSIAERYEAARRHPNHLCLKSLVWDEFLGDSLLQLPETVKVIEPMCGFADGLSILRERIAGKIDYSGFDYSGEVVNRLNAGWPDIRVWQQDVSVFESDEKYDVVILLGGLHHVPHIAADVVRRLAGCLSPSGFFINLEPTHGNWLFRRIRESIYRRNTLFDETTERAFSVDELIGLFESSGLQAKSVLYPGLLAYVMYYNPDAFPRLNIGGTGMVRTIWKLERPFIRSRLARSLSFATLSLWQKAA